MKVKRVVQMVSATTDTGRLACDMYDLDAKEYYSEAQAENIPIADMDFQHLVRAFVKLCREQDPNEGKVLDINMAESDLYKTIDAQERIIAGLRSQVETLSDKVKDQDRGRVLRIKDLKEQLEEKDQEYMDYTAKIERQRDMYKNMANEVHRTNGCAYIFCEVPQDEEGKEFIKNCKKYLNKPSYAIRVRGQHLKKELYGQGRASWGANMEDSSHMRVYIDKKKGDKV